MIRLKRILLASALVPAVAIALSPARAQAPDQGERHQNRRHDGGQADEGHKRAQNREERREDHGPRGAGKEERAGGERREPHKASDEDHHERRKAGGEERREPRKLGNEDHRDERKPGNGERREERKLGNEDRHEQRKLGNEEHRDERRLGNENRREERKLGGEERRDDRKLGGEERRDERRLGNEERRDQRRLGNEERRDQRRPGGEERRDERRLGNEERRDERRPGAPGAAVGFAGGGFLPPTNARRIDDLRRDRREVREGDRTFIREPGRTIVEERGRTFIVHDEVDRFRALGLDVQRERRGNQFYERARRPNGDVIVTITDDNGRMLRRLRRDPGGREIVLIDNGVGGRIRPYAEDVVVLPPPPMRIPRDRYVVDYGVATPALIYDTLVAPPLAPPPQRYTLDQIRYSPDVRSYVRQVDINTINFDTGSWEVPHAADGKLEALATAMGRAIERNPNSVFLIEGYTDATGNATDNLSLSDRRAQSVAEILTKEFKVPPENLTTQGYGQQNLKEETQGPSAANRRVVVRNITQLLASGGAPTGH